MTTATIVICMIFRDMMTFPVVLLLAFYFFHAPQPFIYCLLNVLSLLPVLVVFALLYRIVAFVVASPWVVLKGLVHESASSCPMHGEKSSKVTIFKEKYGDFKSVKARIHRT